MELRKFKTFENKEDSKQLEFDFDNKLTFKKPSIPKDYVLLLPSGEVLLLKESNHLFELINKNLVDYNYSYRGVILNCYCAFDKDINKIKAAIDELKSTVNDKQSVIAKEYIKLMSNVTKKNNTVGYIKVIDEVSSTGRDSIDYYYIIIPDLTINTNYYRRILEEMVDATRKMREKYPYDIFSFTDRLNKSNVKYYNL